MKRNLPYPLLVAMLVLALLLAMGVSPLVGVSEISLARVFDETIPPEQNADRLVFLTFRLPRVLLGALVGGTLSVGGVVFQALLRNGLATPYTLGISGGATLGALMTMSLGGAALGGVAGVAAVPLAAFVGGAATVLLVLALAARAPGGNRGETLLLAGVTLNLLYGAAILVAQWRADPYQAYGMIRWMMGGLDVEDLRVPLALAGPLLVILVGLGLQAPALNLMTLGDRAAGSLGVSPGAVRMGCLLGTALAVSLCVAYAGPIGFVGLIVPHTMRRLAGADHRRLLPASALAGAAFLVLCDTAGRLVGGMAEFPVGVVTASLGGPFFLWILLRKGS